MAAHLTFFRRAGLASTWLLLGSGGITAATANGLAGAATPRQQAKPTTIAAVVPAGAAAGATAAPAAPQVVQLRGIVRLPDGQPCAGASVYPAGAPRQLTITDAQGNFTLPVPFGAATSLRVEYFGVGSSRVEVPVPSAAILHVTLGR